MKVVISLLRYNPFYPLPGTSHRARIASRVTNNTAALAAPIPIYDPPISGMTTRPKVPRPVEYGNEIDFWVEYPSGLIDISRKTYLQSIADGEGLPLPPPLKPTQVNIEVDRGRTIRIDKEASAIVIIDMQK